MYLGQSCRLFIQVLLLGALLLLGSAPTNAAPAESLVSSAPPCPPQLPGSGTKPPNPCSPPLVVPEHICLRLASQSQNSNSLAAITTYQLVANNNGPSNADDILITLAFQPDIQTLLDATFSNPKAWVSATRAGMIELRMKTLDRGEMIIATLRFRTKPDATTGSIAATRASMEWQNRVYHYPSLSNRETLIAGGTGSNPIRRLEIAPTSRIATLAVTYDGFASHEVVSLWYHRPNGETTSLEEVRTDSQGRLTYDLTTTNLPSGSYRLVAQGHCSRATAIGTFSLMEEPPALWQGPVSSNL